MGLHTGLKHIRSVAPFIKTLWSYAFINISCLVICNVTIMKRLQQGRFPDMDFGKDGYDTLSPVNAYDRQNDYGVFLCVRK